MQLLFVKPNFSAGFQLYTFDIYSVFRLNIFAEKASSVYRMKAGWNRCLNERLKGKILRCIRVGELKKESHKDVVLKSLDRKEAGVGWYRVTDVNYENL